MQSAIRVLLESVGGLRVVAMASSEMEATQRLQADVPDWDIAIVDLLLDTGSGFNLIPRLRESHADGHIVVASQFVTAAVAQRCTRLGADAAFCKAHPSEFAEYLASLVQARRTHQAGAR